MREKRLCSHGVLLFLPDINLLSVKVDNRTKDSVHTTLSFFLSVYWPKANQLGFQKKRLCSHGVLLFLPDIDLSSVKVDNRTKDSVHTTLSFFLSFFLSAGRRPIRCWRGHWNKKTLFTWEATVSADHRPISCWGAQWKLHSVHTGDYSFSNGQRPISWTLGKDSFHMGGCSFYWP